jgi:hypothetical protein
LGALRHIWEAKGPDLPSAGRGLDRPAARLTASLRATAIVAVIVVSGVLYAVGGAELARGVDTALMIAGIGWILSMRHRSPARPPVDGPVVASLLSGLRFVARANDSCALSLDLFAVFFGGAVALLPIFARDILHVGPAGLGMLRPAPAVGAILVSSALSGAFEMVSVVIRSTLLQIVTPEPLLGRVSAVNSVFVGSSNEIRALESGVAAKPLGRVPSVVFGGLATLAVVIIIAWRIPSLRRLDLMPMHSVDHQPPHGRPPSEASTRGLQFRDTPRTPPAAYSRECLPRRE